MPLELYPFRYRCPITGRWIRSRYKAELHKIAELYDKWGWEVTGPPEVRTGAPSGWFSPHRKIISHADAMRLFEPAPDMNPTLNDELERLLALLFLQRYVTYCARRRRFAQMQGAARLHLELRR